MQTWVEANKAKPPAGIDVPALAAWIAEQGRESEEETSSSWCSSRLNAALCSFPVFFSRHRYFFQPTQPGPRTTWPGFAPVCSPSRSTCVPFTNTCTMPTEYWCGLSNVARSLIFAGSNTTMSAKQPLSRQPRSFSLKLSAGRRVRRRIASCSVVDLLIAHVAAEEARERAVGARMRVAQQERTFRRRRLGVRADVHPGLRQAELHVLFRHQEVRRADARVILDHEIDRCVLGRHAAHLRDFGERLAGQRLELLGLEADQQHALRRAGREQQALPVGRSDRASPR